MEWMLLIVFLGAQNTPVTIPMENDEACLLAADKVAREYVQKMRATGATQQMAETAIFTSCLHVEE